MSSTSFLSQARKAGSNKTARTIKELANKYQKIYTSGVVIQEEGLLDSGQTAKGRVLIDNNLHYAKKTITIPTFLVPEEPDHDLLTFWIKGNHTGYHPRDISTFDNVITANNNKHWCLADSGALDVGYLGMFNGVNSSPCWKLNGIDDSGEVTDNTRLQVKGTTVGFSVAAWVKISDFSQHQATNRRIVSKQDDASNAYCFFVTSTNKAGFTIKFANVEYKVETPATLALDTWYFLVGTFKSTATIEARIYLNSIVSTTAFAGTIVYPTINTNLQLFTNGNDGHLGDIGDFSGYVRDVRIWRNKILSQTEINQFFANKNTISNIPLGSVMLAGFTYTGGDMDLSSFTTTSFTTTSFNT
jgi:Concanavalin A-like lectin/glucanases superfamily